MTTISVGVVRSSGTKDGVEVMAPDTCPICWKGIEPQVITTHSPTPVPGGHFTSPTAQVVFRCPRNQCQSVFMINYSEGAFGWRGTVAPAMSPREPTLPDAVRVISPDFVEIYKQASEAEQRSLTRIAGTGYRKALEFLIKDYLVSKRPADADAIRKSQLGACIQNYIDDPRVKEVAKRATWLGNDETHYARLWEDKTIEDLKRMIDLTVHWIAMEDATNQALSEMPEGRSVT